MESVCFGLCFMAPCRIMNFKQVQITSHEMTPPGWMLHLCVLAQFKPPRTLKLFPKWLWPIGTNKPVRSRGIINDITHIMLETAGRLIHWATEIIGSIRKGLTRLSCLLQKTNVSSHRVSKHTWRVTCCDPLLVPGDSRSAGYTCSAPLLKLRRHRNYRQGWLSRDVLDILP